MMRRQATNTRTRRGFTTTEVLVAVSLCTIASVMAVAGFQLYQKESPVQSAAARLARAFATARTYAVANNAPYAVQLDTVRGRFWIDEMNTTGGTAVPMVTNPEPLGEQVTLDGIRFGSGAIPLGGRVAFDFAPDGHGKDAAVYLRLAGGATDEPRNICTVKLYGPTGQARVFASRYLSPDGATTTMTLQAAGRARRR